MSTQIQTASEKKVFLDLDSYDRIRAHSSERVNESVRSSIEQNIRELGANDYPALSQRIDELDREWDIDRATMAFFAAAASVATVLGLTRNKKWFALHAVQFPFMIFHAALGWCPPMGLFRRLGFRSTKEIDAEKYALKTMRGDFAA